MVEKEIYPNNSFEINIMEILDIQQSIYRLFNTPPLAEGHGLLPVEEPSISSSSYMSNSMGLVDCMCISVQNTRTTELTIEEDKVFIIEERNK